MGYWLQKWSPKSADGEEELIRPRQPLFQKKPDLIFGHREIIVQMRPRITLSCAKNLDVELSSVSATHL